MDLEALGIHSYDLDDLAQTQKTIPLTDKKGRLFPISTRHRYRKPMRFL